MTVLALIYLLFADYHPMALAVLLTLIFVFYVVYRILLYIEEDCFTPNRLRVSILWAVIGIDRGTEEFDTGPVRAYFSLLLLLFTGLVIRPVAQWVVA